MFRTLSKNNKHSIPVPGVLLGILFFGFENTFCFELSENLYSIFNFPQQNIITFYDTYNTKSEITAKYSYQDIYRKRINGNPALFSLDNVFFFYGFYPFKFNDINQAVHVKISSNKLRFSNENDRSSVIGTSDLNGIKSSIRWSMTRGIGLAGIGMVQLKVVLWCHRGYIFSGLPAGVIAKQVKWFLFDRIYGVR